MLTVIEYAGPNKWGGARWKVQCECGKIKEMNGSSVKKAINCGCEHFGRRAKIVGQKTGKLTVLEFVGIGKDKNTTWKVQCDCGVVKEMSNKSIRANKSCGECGHLNWKGLCPTNTCKIRGHVDQLCDACKNLRRKYDSEYSVKINSRWKSAKSAAKRRKISFSFSLEEYTKAIEPECYYCNGEFNTPSKCGVGLDRLDNSKGYDIENVVSCCTTCNYLRGDILSPEETKVAVQAILKFRKEQ